MKVKILQVKSRSKLEDSINTNILELENKGFKIIDIKLSEDRWNFTVMIMYRKKKKKVE